ncbi:MAG TPA: Do family serine endopeptidase [Thermoanaerobaculia bacterium]|nr:Do family serine endopeptidase [Thermoanaerobaculia bacterium]
MEQARHRNDFRYPAFAAGLLVLGAVTGIGLGGTRSRAAAASATTSTSTSASTSASAPAVVAPASSAAYLPRPANDVFPAIAKAETSAVVNVTISQSVQQTSFEGLPEQFFGRRFNFGTPENRRETRTGEGSGFIIDASGFILTNRHVVDGAERVTVTLADGHKYNAKVVGQDRRTDVALLKIEPKETLTALKLGDSGRAQVGEWVMAVGNPFGLGGNSVTVGVVSYKGRPLDISGRRTPIDMIQTDAAINPGNSGGPLLDTAGEVIGINSLIITQGVPQSSGVGFAVPIDDVKQILPQLKEKGHVVRGWLGVQVQAMDEDLAKSFGLKDNRGALVAEVQSGSPAAKAGLKSGDVIISADGKPVADGDALTHAVSSKAPGATMEIGAIREDSQKTFTVHLETFPEQGEKGDNAETPKSAKLGVQVRPLTPDIAQQLGLSDDARGLAVMGVESGSPAERAGVREGDVIVNVNGHSVSNASDLRSALEASKGNARLRVRRGDGYLFLAIPNA